MHSGWRRCRQVRRAHIPEYLVRAISSQLQQQKTGAVGPIRDMTNDMLYMFIHLFIYKYRKERKDIDFLFLVFFLLQIIVIAHGS